MKLFLPKQVICTFILAALFVAPPSQGGINFQETVLFFDIPAKELTSALTEYAIQSKISVIVDNAQIQGYTSSPIIGQLTPSMALNQLLSKSPYSFKYNRALESIQIIPAKNAPLALEQQSNPDSLKSTKNSEELVVVGIRGALIKAQDIKYQKQGIIEAITEEDIGKFPDSNLAESMQRLSGVTISYSNNEGNKVSVRGFDSTFNLVLLNGRQMPASGIQDDAAAGTRSFNFADLASESISSVEVYKTSLASMPTGGIGSVIDIKTARPLSHSHTKTIFGVKAVSDTTTVTGDKITPELFGLASTTFDDERFGLLASFSYQERDSRAETVSMKWIKARELAYQNGDIPDVYYGDTPPWQPENINFTIADYERERTNGQLVFQYRPHESFTTTLDYVVSQLKVSGSGFNFINRFALPFLDGSDITFDENVTFTEMTQAGSWSNPALDSGNTTFDRFISQTKNINDSIGVNLAWNYNDRWNVILDAHSSNSKLKPFGSGSYVTISHTLGNIYSQTFDANYDIPQVSYVFIDDTGGTENPVIGRTQIALNDFIEEPAGIAEWETNEENINQIQLNTTWLNDDKDHILNQVHLGVSAVNQTNRSTKQRYNNIDPSLSFGVTNFDQSPYYREPTDSYFNQFSGGLNGIDYIYNFDIDAQSRAIHERLRGHLVEDSLSDFNEYQIASWYPLQSPSNNPQDDNTIEEDTLSGFLQANLQHQGTFFNTQLNIGLRYEETKVNNISRFTAPINVRWAFAEAFFTEPSATKQRFVKTGDYDALLPSLNLRFDIKDSFVTRLAYSETLARPDMNLIRAADSLTSAPHQEERTGFKGNPRLKPYYSKNYDLSLEWYHSEYNYLAVALFTKKVDGYPAATRTEETLFGLRDVYNGPRAQQAREDLIADGVDPTDENVFNLLVERYPPGEGNIGVLSNEDDPLMLWTITSTINSDEVNIEGWEISIQQLLGDSGFGTVLNYTSIKSDANFQLRVTEFETPFPASANFFNFIGFYEKYGFSFRLAFHWNDEFPELSNTSAGIVPIYTESYGQWDALISYTWNEQLTLSFEGINITDEAQRTYNGVRNRLDSAAQYGPRYSLGLRYTF